jgi:DNA topoisomerase-1
MRLTLRKDIVSKKNLVMNILRQEIITTKSASAQEAHEAIRPTDFSVKKIGDAQLNKLYQLIYKRTLASLRWRMQKLKKPLSKSEILKLCQHFEAQGEVIVFDGF